MLGTLAWLNHGAVQVVPASLELPMLQSTEGFLRKGLHKGSPQPPCCSLPDSCGCLPWPRRSPTPCLPW